MARKPSSRAFNRNERLRQVVEGRNLQYLETYFDFFSPENLKKRLGFGKIVTEAVNHPSKPINEEVFIADLRGCEQGLRNIEHLTKGWRKHF